MDVSKFTTNLESALPALDGGDDTSKKVGLVPRVIAIRRKKGESPSVPAPTSDEGEEATENRQQEQEEGEPTKPDAKAGAKVDKPKPSYSAKAFTDKLNYGNLASFLQNAFKLPGHSSEISMTPLKKQPIMISKVKPVTVPPCLHVMTLRVCILLVCLRVRPRQPNAAKGKNVKRYWKRVS